VIYPTTKSAANLALVRNGRQIVSEDIFQLSVSILTIANRLLDADIQKCGREQNAEAYSF
jgi:hypothetical protein